MELTELRGLAVRPRLSVRSGTPPPDAAAVVGLRSRTVPPPGPAPVPDAERR